MFDQKSSSESGPSRSWDVGRSVGFVMRCPVSVGLMLDKDGRLVSSLVAEEGVDGKNDCGDYREGRRDHPFDPDDDEHPDYDQEHGCSCQDSFNPEDQNLL